MVIVDEKKANSMVMHVKSRKIDASSAVDFKNFVNSVVDAGGRDIILDLREVEFIDSSGLGAIVCILKHVGQEGSLVISGATQAVERMFKMTRMDRVFRLYPNVDAALNSASVPA